MHVLSPKGRIKRVERIIPIIEKVIDFNGIRRKLCEPANELTEANGVNVISQHEEWNYGTNFIVGNLPNSEVMKILRNAGGYDFTVYSYQKIGKLEDIVIDDGVSAPYTTDENPFISSYGNYAGVVFGANADIDEDADEDLDEYDDYESEEED